MGFGLGQAMTEADRRICDYEGSAYRSEFWGQGREYEDAAERVALRRLLPPSGRRLIDIGGGYGRLFPLYSGYDEIVLFDYAHSQLRQGVELWGHAAATSGPRYTYVAGDFYRFPFALGTFDTVVIVRTLHHAVDAPAVLAGVSRILAPGGAFVLEYANKRNLKAMVRYGLGRQAWSPFDRRPVEFVELNFDFHPAWIRDQLEAVGLEIESQRTVSHFRLGLLKRLLPTGLLVGLDRLLQPTGGFLQFSPSVFVRSRAGDEKAPAPAGALFRCTICGSTMMEERADVVACVDCGARFAIRDGIYDFKAPIEEGGP